jgi:hypothetical protein
MPASRMEDGRYYVGRLARAVTKSKRARTFYASSVVVGEIEGYVESARARVVRRAQALDRYDDLPTRLVTHETGRRRRVLHWRDRDGVIGQTPLAEATEEERMSFVTEGQDGPQPLWLWLWLNESGLPFRPGFVGCVLRARRRALRGSAVAGDERAAPSSTRRHPDVRSRTVSPLSTSPRTASSSSSPPSGSTAQQEPPKGQQRQPCAPSGFPRPPSSATGRPPGTAVTKPRTTSDQRCSTTRPCWYSPFTTAKTSAGAPS